VAVNADHVTSSASKLPADGDSVYVTVFPVNSLPPVVYPLSGLAIASTSGDGDVITSVRTSWVTHGV